MRLEIIESRIELNPHMTAGIVDRRYKTGFRVLPEPVCSPVVGFTIAMNLELRVSQTLNLFAKWGTYIVISIDTMKMVMEIVPVRRNYLQECEMLTIPEYIDCLPGPFVTPAQP